MIDKEKILSDLGDCLAYYESGEPEDNEENLNREIKRYITNINNGHFDIKPETCLYTPDNHYTAYETSCGNELLIGDPVRDYHGTLSMNDFKFCPYCEKYIEEVKNDR